MSTVTVTGGAGFIGSHLVHALLAKGDHVCVIDDFSTGRLSNLQDVLEHIELVEGSILDEKSLARAVSNSEVIYHQAAQVSVPYSLENPQHTMQTNGEGTRRVLEAAARTDCRRVIYAGSSSCYGNVSNPIQTETDEIAPISPYGIAKYQGEEHCHAIAASGRLETVVLRYFNVFGPGQDPSSPYSAVIPKFIALILDGQQPRIFGDGTQSRDFTFVQNIVEANLLAAEAQHVSGQSINVANGRSISLLKLTELLSRYLQCDVRPEFSAAREGDILHSCANISKATDLLGYVPSVGIEVGLAATVKAFRDDVV
ncbi:MAG: NAD-dependent epimerase/dehydratase family protein [Pirellulales bacterium]|nr:NAD-dependent epimerase/dehydratase family protein [Pirellulales bacterium]